MNKLKYILLYCGFAGIVLFSQNGLEAKTAGEKLDSGIEKVNDKYEKTKNDAKNNYEKTREEAKDNYEKAKDNLKEKYNDGLEKSKAK